MYIRSIITDNSVIETNIEIISLVDCRSGISAELGQHNGQIRTRNIPVSKCTNFLSVDTARNTFFFVRSSLLEKRRVLGLSGFRAACILHTQRQAVITRIFSLDLNSRLSFAPIGSRSRRGKTHRHTWLPSVAQRSHPRPDAEKSTRVQGDASFSLQRLPLRFLARL